VKLDGLSVAETAGHCGMSEAISEGKRASGLAGFGFRDFAGEET
jgi:hypothetical protein